MLRPMGTMSSLTTDVFFRMCFLLRDRYTHGGEGGSSLELVDLSLRFRKFADLRPYVWQPHQTPGTGDGRTVRLRDRTLWKRSRAFVVGTAENSRP